MILYQAICGDFIEGTPANAKTATVYCPACRCTRTITGVVVKEWYARCYNCRFKRWHGVNEILARFNADRHWRKNRGHKTTFARANRPASEEALENLQKRGVKVAKLAA